jgi:hypothetical protein
MKFFIAQISGEETKRHAARSLSRRATERVLRQGGGGDRAWGGEADGAWPSVEGGEAHREELEEATVVEGGEVEWFG